MTEMTPDVAALGEELARAIRTDRQRRRHRARTMRAVAVAAASALALSGTALGAGAALGVIDLGSGAQAVRVHQVPRLPAELLVCPSGHCGGKDARYVYRITAAGHTRVAPRDVTCGPEHAELNMHPRTVYVMSPHALTPGELDLTSRVLHSLRGAHIPRGGALLEGPCRPSLVNEVGAGAYLRSAPVTGRRSRSPAAKGR